MKSIVNILSVEDRRGTRQTTKILTRTREKTILTSPKASCVSMCENQRASGHFSRPFPYVGLPIFPHCGMSPSFYFYSR